MKEIQLFRATPSVKEISAPFASSEFPDEVSLETQDRPKFSQNPETCQISVKIFRMLQRHGVNSLSRETAERALQGVKIRHDVQISIDHGNPIMIHEQPFPVSPLLALSSPKG